jgi:hypothetical protein
LTDAKPPHAYQRNKTGALSFVTALRVKELDADELSIPTRGTLTGFARSYSSNGGAR